jgi:hypothetical protein
MVEVAIFWRGRCEVFMDWYLGCGIHFPLIANPPALCNETVPLKLACGHRADPV